MSPGSILAPLLPHSQITGDFSSGQFEVSLKNISSQRTPQRHLSVPAQHLVRIRYKLPERSVPLCFLPLLWCRGHDITLLLFFIVCKEHQQIAWPLASIPHAPLSDLQPKERLCVCHKY